jgi:hypothetical protein
MNIAPQNSSEVSKSRSSVYRRMAEGRVPESEFPLKISELCISSSRLRCQIYNAPSRERVAEQELRSMTVTILRIMTVRRDFHTRGTRLEVDHKERDQLTVLTTFQMKILFSIWQLPSQHHLDQVFEMTRGEET